MSGLAAKIKEALTGDHHEPHGEEVKTPNTNVPGAFPADVKDTWTGTTGPADTSGFTSTDMAATAPGAAALGSGDHSTHNKLHKANDPRSETDSSKFEHGYVNEHDKLASAAREGADTSTTSTSHDPASTPHNPTAQAQRNPVAAVPTERDRLASAASVGDHGQTSRDSGAAGSGVDVGRSSTTGTTAATGATGAVAGATAATGASGAHSGIEATSATGPSMTTSGHHDPEFEAKKATSAAGNYPYWGDLKVGENPHSQIHDTSHTGRDAALGAGALGAGAGAAGVGGHLLHKDEQVTPSQNQDLTPTLGTDPTSTTAPTSTSTPQTSSITGATSAAQPLRQDTPHHTGRDAALGAGVLSAGAAGAGYLASKDKDQIHGGQSVSHEPLTDIQKSTSAEGNYPYGDESRGSQGLSSQNTTRHGGVGAGDGALGINASGPATSGMDTSGTGTGTSSSTGGFMPDRRGQTSGTNLTGAGSGVQEGSDHHYGRDAALGAGSLGAGALASHEISDRSRHGQDQVPTVTTGSTTTPAPTHSTGVASGTGYGSSRPQHVPGRSIQGQQSTLPGQQSTPLTSSTQHDNSHATEKGLGAGAGIAGSAGAAYYMAHHNDKDDSSRNPVTSSTANTQQDVGTSGVTGPAAAGGVYNTVTGHGSSEAPQHREFPLSPGSKSSTPTSTTVGPQHGTVKTSLGDVDAPTSSDNRDRQGLAAAGSGAGAGIVGSMLKHHHDGNTARGDIGQSSAPATQQPITVKEHHHHHHQDQPTTTTEQTSHHRWNPFSSHHDKDPATSSATGSTTDKHKQSGLGNAITGTAAGAAAGAAWNKHNSPAQGTTTPAPSMLKDTPAANQTVSDYKHRPTGSSGPSEGSVGVTTLAQRVKEGSRVLHNCSSCGKDEDISKYFKEDAVFHAD